MPETYYHVIAQELNLQSWQVKAVNELLDEGATVPFVARYRKEKSGNCDEVMITEIRDRITRLRELDKRRETILSGLEERGLLTEELKERLLACTTMSSLEDTYLPYRPKKRTRATIARERGLGPLAEDLWRQDDRNPHRLAEGYLNPERGVETVEDALAGARDIIAERISEEVGIRETIRSLFLQRSLVRCHVVPGQAEQGAKYRDYFQWEEPLVSIPSHRMLAIRRGEKEEILICSVAPPEEEVIGLLEKQIIKGDSEATNQVRQAMRDGYRRLLGPTMETETRVWAKKRADRQAIDIFTDNLRELLLSPPLGQKRVLAIDPGFRTGCKVVALDEQGRVLHHETLFFHHSPEKDEVEGEKLRALCLAFQIQAVAVGNGTAGRETEGLIRRLDLPFSVAVVLVNESGASVYSASEVAREEFPDHDVTVRGAISIGRRLVDPLAELVKIDPKSIGVGQYQHDVDQAALKLSLDDMVFRCVNLVGVEVNTASRELLTYVSGLGPQLARHIVQFRETNGPFRSRQELLQVPRLGKKAFEQAAGFLRIRAGENPLDGSAVHPESYAVVEAMARDLSASVVDLIRNPALRRNIVLERYISDPIGLPTLTDILSELAKPGRDPRERFEMVNFAEHLRKLDDVRPGMRVPGVVTNVTAFGAFVDIGVHQDGLVHISQLSDRYIRNPAEVVKVNQRVTVTILGVDLERKRIALSMKTNQGEPAPDDG